MRYGQAGRRANLRDGKVAAADFAKKEGLLLAPAKLCPPSWATGTRPSGAFDSRETHAAFAAHILATLKAW